MEPRAVLDYDVNEFGSPVNRYVLKERDNKGLVGLHFDPAVMSLRARLNRGVELQYVDYDVTENDPNKLAFIARNISAKIDSRIQQRAVSQVEISSSVESSKSE